MAARRILIIDDSQLIQKVARMSLEKVGGWQVLAASSGGEGLTVAEAEQPDAILLDMMMPDMEGPDVFQRLRASEKTSHIPVVFMTARDDSPRLRQLVEGASVRVISKPFEPLRLPGQVAEALGWAS